MIRTFRKVPEDIREWDRWIRTLETRGSFTGTLTGLTTTEEAEVFWHRVGDRMTLSLVSALSGTSNTTALTLTGLPTELSPTNDKVLPSAVTDNGGDELGTAALSSVVITFALGSPLSSTGFTNTGTKGLPAGWQFYYLID